VSADDGLGQLLINKRVLLKTSGSVVPILLVTPNLCVYVCNSIRASVSGPPDPSCPVVYFNH